MAKKLVGEDKFKVARIRMDILEAAHEAAMQQLKWHFMNYIKNEETDDYEYKIDPDREEEYNIALGVVNEIADLL